MKNFKAITSQGLNRKHIGRESMKTQNYPKFKESLQLSAIG
ncbi:hypothetical protein ALT1644_660008 [Alteromonas macleodii]